ncbi:MAG: antitoxin Xre/MbcA/ParS toxin-binding domain-containing protein, partial [Verrucomicrobiota bacterium]
MKTASPTRKKQSAPVRADAHELIRQVRKGLHFRKLEALQAGVDLPLEQLAGKLAISRSTLLRRKALGRLTPDESDRVMRFARLVQHAADVFGDAARGRQWLKLPQRALGGAAPLDYAETELGAREV